MVPLTFTVAVWGWRRRVDPIGVLAIGGFAIAIAVTVLSGGSALPLELRRSVVTGVIGLACVFSVVVQRPLWLPTMRLLARVKPERATVIERILQRAESEPETRRRLTIATLLIGFTFIAESAPEAVLAVNVSTSTFLVVRLAIGCVGAAIVIMYVCHLRARR